MNAVGIIGVGNMGGGMLARLRSLQVAVAVCDVDPLRVAQARQLGAQVCESPTQLVQSLGPEGARSGGGGSARCESLVPAVCARRCPMD